MLWAGLPACQGSPVVAAMSGVRAATGWAVDMLAGHALGCLWRHCVDTVEAAARTLEARHGLVE